jgi:hypothetical protein
VTRGRLVWLLSIPLIVASTELAHVVAYRLIYPDPEERTAVLASSGHGYFTYDPLCLAVGAALVVCALLGRAIRAHVERETSAARISAAPFAALPPATFVLQEHLERLLHGGAFPFGTALEPTFLIGLLLQLPFAVLAYVLARLLLRAAERLGTVRRTRPPRCTERPLPGRSPRASFVLPRLAPLVTGSSGRGPPTKPRRHIRARSPRYVLA